MSKRKTLRIDKNPMRGEINDVDSDLKKLLLEADNDFKHLKYFADRRLLLSSLPALSSLISKLQKYLADNPDCDSPTPQLMLNSVLALKEDLLKIEARYRQKD